MTRREWIGGAAAAIVARAQSGGALYAYVGCFTSPQRYARGDGIHVYRVDRESGQWSHLQHVPDLVNPSFLVANRQGTALYSVHADETYATAFAIDRATGRLTLINRAPSGGRNGVHQAIDPSGKFLVVANYGAGNVGVLPIRADGGLDDATEVVALPGQPGPHRVEQSSSHPHQIVFDPSGKFVVAPDKGLDRIFVFAFDPVKGKLTPTAQGAGVARTGSGPRHAAFSPTRAVLWVLNEISSTVSTWQWDSERGHMRPVQILSTLPAEYTGENTASEIVVARTGKTVYCSNRGHDSICAFAADPETGLLSTPVWSSTNGRTPRFMGFDPAERFLYAANEQSDNIVSFRPNAKGLAPGGQTIRTPSPSTIAFVAI